MAQRVTAIFKSRDDAERAADALVSLGADRAQISMVARGEEGATGVPSTDRPAGEHMVEPAREVGDSGAALTTTDQEDAARGAATGAAMGAAVGIAAGLASLMVPGIGLILAAGPLAWAIGGAVGTAAAGAVAGGVYGGLRDIGIEEKYARTYEERIRGGHVLMTALVPVMSQDRIRQILDDHNAEDVSFSEAPSPAPAAFPAGEAAIAQPAYQPTTAMGPSMTAPGAIAPDPAAVGTPTTLPSASIAERDTMGYSANVVRGEAKQVEGEVRDRAADRTVNPLDDVAAKGEKVEGKLEEEFAEEEEEVVERRPL